MKGGDGGSGDDGSSSGGSDCRGRSGGGGGGGGGGGSGHGVFTTSSDHVRSRRKERRGARVAPPEEGVIEHRGEGLEGKGKQERPRKGRRRKAGADRLEVGRPEA